jgi:Stress responsive A/B Barrel Domain
MGEVEPSLRHISLFTMYEQADDDTVATALELLRSLSEDDGILEWRVEESLDARKGRVIAENGLFRSMAAKERWRVSEKHQQVVAFMREHADWIVADYFENPNQAS